MPDQLFFDIVKMVVALACIVGLLFFVVWLLKRFLPGISRTPIERVDLGVIAQMSLGSRQRVAVIRVADRTLVIGVTEGSITTLAELPTPQTAPAAKKEADDPKIFADLLAWRKDSPEPAADNGGSSDEPVKPVKPVSPEGGDGPLLFAPGERQPR
ncbi:flagellar biosynthetic protein FliO [Humidesulfovibrio sp.]|uniref:flagellar biosynthetic protein FliO n=1 Tax=Humidesulfovibrio sp. TaxID=2910988 RepID=UPI00280AE9F0|nr:flagellar biosynthetic protein FliO [Humidesulfovibrio sp.]